MTLQILFFLLGLVILSVSGEILVAGAARIARVLRLPPLLIGLVIVAYGTSLPEFVVSVIAALKGSSTIALGNAVGSNLMNTGLILGLAALIFPIATDPRLSRRDLPLHLLFTVLFGGIIWNGYIGRGEGIVLITLMLAYIIFATVSEWRVRKTPDPSSDDFEAEDKEKKQSLWRAVLLILLGSIGLYFGAKLMVEAAIYLAQAFGISERIIGLTIVAAGTSLPELATTLAAARKRYGAMILGNLIGSNIFNIMLVVGTAGALRPFAVDLKQVIIEYGFLLFNAALVTIFLLTGKKLNRIEGSVLVVGYAGFLLMLLLYHI